MVTRGGKITVHFTGKVAIIAIVIGFFIAIAAVAFLFRLGTGILPELGFGFMVWGTATLVFVVAIGSVPYFLRKRDTQP